jgi:hypothetical protein
MKNTLDQPYPLPPEAVDFFQKNRYIKLKNVFDAETLAYYGELISQKVAELNTNDKPLDLRQGFFADFQPVARRRTHPRFCIQQTPG